MGREMKNY